MYYLCIEPKKQITMPPEKNTNKYVESIKASFLREFNNNRKTYEAEQKQPKMTELKTGIVTTNFCPN